MPARFRYLSLALCASTLLLAPLARGQQTMAAAAPSPTATPAANGAPSALNTPKDIADKLIAAAIKKVNANDIDGGLNDLSQALKLNPNSTGAYVLRASLYCQKKQWTQAEDDFKAAGRLAPTNPVLKLNLVDIKFMQKQYDAARAGFLPFVKDPDIGDFASYKVFLCDLFGGHEAVAKKELDVFNDAMGNPSYYFSNAAWCLFHRDLEGARGWLTSASNIYPLRKNAFYAQSLRDLGYLPIPMPGDKVTPPGTAAQAHP
jgi:tetratricopeptide (TPR) repeat protein